MNVGIQVSILLLAILKKDKRKSDGEGGGDTFNFKGFMDMRLYKTNIKFDE